MDRQPERRPPWEQRFEKPLAEKGEGGEFTVDRSIIDQPIRGCGDVRRGRGGRRRGMGRGDGFDSRGKCEFDRHRGTDRSGLKHEGKHGGSLSHNWGTVNDELTDLKQSNVTEEMLDGEEHPVADIENKENEVEEVKEEGPKEITLDEWKAIQNKDQAKQNLISKNQMKVLMDSGRSNLFFISQSEEIDAEDSVMDHHFRKLANNITSQLEINFGDLGCPGHGGMGGRGGRGCGGHPNHGSRTDKSSASAPDVDIPKTFPTLA